MPDVARAETWEHFPVLDLPLNDDAGEKSRHGGQVLRKSVQCASCARNRMQVDRIGFTMLHATQIAEAGSPYVVVIGNEKGGSGKTTLAMHLAVALLKEGQRVGTIDLDSNQKGLTRYIENRRIWANHRRIELEMPLHHLVLRAEGAKLRDNEAEELAAFEGIISGIRKSVDFLVIDTPSTDAYLMRLAHLVADKVLTPVTDSFLDLGTLASVDPVTHEVTGTGHYAEMVREARMRRRQFDQGHIDWIVIRNRSARGQLKRIPVILKHSLRERNSWRIRLGLVVG